MNVHVFDRLCDVLAFEQMFNDEVGMKEWSFKDRSVWQRLTNCEFKQMLAESMSNEPQVLTKLDEEKGKLYLALYFKSPPGRILYNQWKADSALVPSFDTFKKMDAASREQQVCMPMAEDDIGIIEEQRTLAMPSDGSRIDVRRLKVSHRLASRVAVTKRDCRLAIKPCRPVDDSLLRDMIKKEIVAVLDDGTKEQLTAIESSENELNTSLQRQREEEKASKLEAEQALLDEKTLLARDYFDSACELLVDLSKDCRLLFESNLTRVDRYSPFTKRGPRARVEADSEPLTGEAEVFVEHDDDFH